MITRRKFVALTVAAPAIVQRRTALTAQQIVDRIQQQIGGMDTFKAGDPATPVQGIAASAMATMDVLKQAARAGANLIITCEPTFYAKADTTASDAVVAAKNDFIKNNQLVIWRFERWRARMPNPLSSALADALGWSKLLLPDDARRVAISGQRLDALVSDIKKKLNSRGGIRVVGDPAFNVKKIGLLPGTTAIQSALELFPLVDTIVAGEVREWESVELARDKFAAGAGKSLVLLGRVVSENPGMDACAKWLKSVVPEVPSTWIPVEDPYWRPA